MSEIEISDYGIFNDGIKSIKTLNSKLETTDSEISTCKSNLSDESTFLGPIANISLEAFKDVDSKMTVIVSNFNKEGTYLEEVANMYNKSDAKSSSTITGADDSTIRNTNGEIQTLYIDENGNIKTNVVKALGNTQASSFYALGDKAYNAWQADDPAIQEWIEKVGKIVQNTNTYGMKKSLIIAQIINESGWMSSHASSLSQYNNVLGINTDMGRIKPDMQTSTWSKKQTSGYNNVTQWSADGTHIVPSNESMRHYDSIEECIEDYANVLYLYHPECKGSNNIEDYRSFLESYTPNPNASTTDKYANMINKFNLSRFDV